ncbi:hypothetical protein UACE39S_01739 [Ureibacillus acetophenoni]
MTISKKIVSALVVSSLAFSSFAPSLANAKSVELEPIASPQLTGYSNAELEKLAIEILANGKFSNVVVTEGDILEVPEGFTPISNFSFTEGSTITPFGVDPGGGTSYWDGWYTYNTDIPTWAVVMGAAYVGTWIAEKYKIPSKVTAALMAGAGYIASKPVSTSGTMFYKAISLTKAEYYTTVYLYVDGKLVSSSSGTWVAEIDPNTD